MEGTRPDDPPMGGKKVGREHTKKIKKKKMKCNIGAAGEGKFL